MDTTTLDKQIAAFRADNEAIRDRLAELDTKLTTWLAALEGAQAALHAATRQVGVTEDSPPDEQPEAPAAKACEVTDGPDPANAVELPPQTPAESVTDAPTMAAAEPEQDSEANLGSGMFRGSASPEPEACDPQAPADGVQAEADDDDEEELLAELDPELANAVRVKRRLTGNRRSVRALLAELGAGPEGSPESGSRAKRRGKKWWRRGDA